MPQILNLPVLTLEKTAGAQGVINITPFANKNMLKWLTNRSQARLLKVLPENKPHAQHEAANQEESDCQLKHHGSSPQRVLAMSTLNSYKSVASSHPAKITSLKVQRAQVSRCKGPFKSQGAKGPSLNL